MPCLDIESNEIKGYKHMLLVVLYILLSEVFALLLKATEYFGTFYFPTTGYCKTKIGINKDRGNTSWIKKNHKMTTLRYSKMLFMAIWIAYPASDLPVVRADDSVRC